MHLEFVGGDLSSEMIAPGQFMTPTRKTWIAKIWSFLNINMSASNLMWKASSKRNETSRYG